MNRLLPALALALLAARASAAEPVHYGVMCDAGSSGTRCYVYGWSPAKKYDHPHRSTLQTSAWPWQCDARGSA